MARAHAQYCFAGAIEGAENVDCKHALHALGGHFIDALSATDNACVVDEATEPAGAELVVDGVEQLQHIVVACNVTRERGGCILAVGTTSLRALESAATTHGVAAGAGETTLFVTPGFRFRVVDRLLTNFHLPKSTLLMLVSAFAGYDNIRAAYRHAIAAKYRFFSYGDAMLLERAPRNDAD